MNTQAPSTVLLYGVVGSTAQGLAREGSDVDTLGVFAAPTLEVAGLDWHSDRESRVTHDPDTSWHEAGKFARLLLKANPSLVELLYLDSYLTLSDHGKTLIDLREHFLDPSKVKSAYAGFARSQVMRFQRNAQSGKIERKTARHTLRLVRQGKELLTSGTLSVKVSDPQSYFDLDNMQYQKVFDILLNEVNTFEDLRGPFALDKFDRSIAEGWLLDVRREFL